MNPTKSGKTVHNTHIFGSIKVLFPVKNGHPKFCVVSTNPCQPKKEKKFKNFERVKKSY